MNKRYHVMALIIAVMLVLTACSSAIVQPGFFGLCMLIFPGLILSQIMLSQ